MQLARDCQDRHTAKLDEEEEHPMDPQIGRATHVMHLEENRFALYRETEAFLRGGDRPPEMSS
jgi:hypothetical protein